MFALIKLVTWPIRFAFTLMKLPFTIMSCITKLGCMLVLVAVVAGIIAVVIYVL